MKYFSSNVFAVALSVAGMFIATSASAIGVNPAGGGGQKWIYDLNNGNRLGLVGVQALSNASVGLADLNGAVNAGTALNWYFADTQTTDYGTPASFHGQWTGTPAEFTPFFDTTIAVLSSGSFAGNNGKLFDALWVEWGGGNLTFSNGTGGTNGFGAGDAATLQGDPLAPVPVPAALPLLLAGLGALVAVKRRRKAA